MGAFREVGRHREVFLDGRCIIGRATSAHWIVRDERVSAEHAVVSYGNEGWNLRDLSSTNGTTLNGAVVRDEVRLKVGTVVSLGHEDIQWEFIDDRPPHATMTEIETGQVFRTTSDFLALPHDEAVEANLYRGDEQWIIESAATAQNAEDEMIVELPSGRFLVRLPLGVPTTGNSTVAVSNVDEPWRMTFLVSPDEEHVRFTIENGRKTKDFDNRSHSYLLLTLARKRLQDELDPACPLSEAGWYKTKELADRFRASPEQLNLWVWRARKQVQDLNPELAALLIERRPSSTSLRLGCPRLQVQRQD